MEPIFLRVEEVIEIHAELIEEFGGSHGLRDRGLLESAVHEPMAQFGGQFLHADLIEMAAAYLFHLVKNHPFVDGNKRIGAAAASVFLRMNDVQLVAVEPEFSDLVLAVAQSLAGKKEIIAFLRGNTRPV